jgi:putative tricarboxylic transport membrane protein
MTSMIAYQNDWTIFFTRPISGTFMALTILALAYPMLRHLRRTWVASRKAVQRGDGRKLQS